MKRFTFKLRSYLFWPFAALLLAALAAVGFYALQTIEQSYRAQLESDLYARAKMLGAALLDTSREAPLSPAKADALCKRLGPLVETRFTLIAPDGRVWGDSEHDPVRMENHLGRPEVQAAARHAYGTAEHFSVTLQKPMLYVAVPLREQGRLWAYARAARPLSWILHDLKTVFADFSLGGLLIAVLAATLSWFMARRLSRPIHALALGAKRFAKGELDYRLPAPRIVELGELTATLNQMAGDLDDRLRTITSQRNEQETVLASMSEAMLVVDEEGRLLHLNRAAALLFTLDEATVVERPLREVIGHAALLRFVARSLAGTGTIEDELVWAGSGHECFLQAHGSPIHDASGTRRVLIVLTDVTRLKRLESLRRDFVANVSHELKTPITSIKGYVETLKDGALDEREDALRFLGVIGRHADRLNAIIDDLLALSRLEQSEQKGAIERAPARLSELVDAVFEVLGPVAAEKGMTLGRAFDPTLLLQVKAPLFEQALLNLIDNAIKYGHQGGRVELRSEVGEKTLRILVSDDGPGIPAEDLPRLFERFYRVDKARSRQQGGTGLGLSIVKHILQVHGGSVEVQSTLGRGSTFTLVLPRS